MPRKFFESAKNDLKMRKLLLIVFLAVLVSSQSSRLNAPHSSCRQVAIHVGRSEEKLKYLRLDNPPSSCNDNPINQLNPEWPDFDASGPHRFKSTILPDMKDTVVISRTDIDDGWHDDLVFQCEFCGESQPEPTRDIVPRKMWQASSELSKCDRERKLTFNEEGLMYTPECKDGQYTPQQCTHDDQCWCMNGDERIPGSEHDYTRQGPMYCKNLQADTTNGNIDAIPQLTKCQEERQRAERSRREGPTCDSEGNFEPMQCVRNQCRCVDDNGVTLEGTESQRGLLRCADSAGKRIPHCHIWSAMSRNQRYSPTCEKDGDFTPLQCDKTGDCWCVDSSGEMKVNSRGRQGTVTCSGHTEQTAESEAEEANEPEMTEESHVEQAAGENEEIAPTDVDEPHQPPPLDAEQTDESPPTDIHSPSNPPPDAVDEPSELPPTDMNEPSELPPTDAIASEPMDEIESPPSDVIDPQSFERQTSESVVSQPATAASQKLSMDSFEVGESLEVLKDGAWVEAVCMNRYSHGIEIYFPNSGEVTLYHNLEEIRKSTASEEIMENSDNDQDLEITPDPALEDTGIPDDVGESIDLSIPNDHVRIADIEPSEMERGMGIPPQADEVPEPSEASRSSTRLGQMYQPPVEIPPLDAAEDIPDLSRPPVDPMDDDLSISDPMDDLPIGDLMDDLPIGDLMDDLPDLPTPPTGSMEDLPDLSAAADNSMSDQGRDDPEDMYQHVDPVVNTHGDLDPVGSMNDLPPVANMDPAPSQPEDDFEFDLDPVEIDNIDLPSNLDPPVEDAPDLLDSLDLLDPLELDVPSGLGVPDGDLLEPQIPHEPEEVLSPPDMYVEEMEDEYMPELSPPPDVLDNVNMPDSHVVPGMDSQSCPEPQPPKQLSIEELLKELDFRIAEAGHFSMSEHEVESHIRSLQNSRARLLHILGKEELDDVGFIVKKVSAWLRTGLEKVDEQNLGTKVSRVFSRTDIFLLTLANMLFLFLLPDQKGLHSIFFSVLLTALLVFTIRLQLQTISTLLCVDLVYLISPYISEKIF